MKKNEKMNQFKESVKDSIKSEMEIEQISSHNYYYKNDYAKPIKDYYDENNYKSKELEKKNGDHLPICSLSSSARLSFLRFKDYKNVKFEQNYIIEKKNGKRHSVAHPDVVLDSCYYECKCQEIVNGERERFVQSYKDDAMYFEEFFGENFDKISEKGKYLEFPLSLLNIDIPKNYYETQFNIKQMMCHLLAIAANDEIKQLQYVIFVPDDYQGRLRDIIYKPLEDEIEKIFDASSNINKFAKLHGIKLKKPQYVKISSIEELKASSF